MEIADVLETYASFRIDLTGFVRAKMNIALRKRAVTFIIGFFVGLATLPRCLDAYDSGAAAVAY